jgi:hypothetical protein
MFGYCDAAAPSLACICAQTDDKCFQNIVCNTRHLLHTLLLHKEVNITPSVTALITDSFLIAPQP